MKKTMTLKIYPIVNPTIEPKKIPIKYLMKDESIFIKIGSKYVPQTAPV